MLAFSPSRRFLRLVDLHLRFAVAAARRLLFHASQCWSFCSLRVKRLITCVWDFRDDTIVSHCIA
jgi:hypothetical protein